jgi:hypothetical protein
MDLVFTNEHIAVAQLCLRCWNGHLDLLGRSEPQFDRASQALRALEEMSPERRLICLNVAAESDPEFEIGVEDLTCIFWTINHVVRYYFNDTKDAPLYLQQVLQHFLEQLRRQNDSYKMMDICGEGPMATYLFKRYRERV